MEHLLTKSNTLYERLKQYFVQQINKINFAQHDEYRIFFFINHRLGFFNMITYSASAILVFAFIRTYSLGLLETLKTDESGKSARMAANRNSV